MARGEISALVKEENHFDTDICLSCVVKEKHIWKSRTDQMNQFSNFVYSLLLLHFKNWGIIYMQENAQILSMTINQIKMT